MIWDAVLGFLRHPHVEQIYGYGVYGQLQSGVVYSYSYLFGDTLQPIYEHAHNLALQTVLDFGYVGLASLAFLVVRSAQGLEHRARLNDSAAALAMLALLLVLALSGTTESYPSYFSLDTLALFVLSCATASSNGDVRSPSAEAHTRDAAAGYRGDLRPR